MKIACLFYLRIIILRSRLEGIITQYIFKKGNINGPHFVAISKINVLGKDRKIIGSFYYQRIEKN